MPDRVPAEPPLHRCPSAPAPARHRRALEGRRRAAPPDTPRAAPHDTRGISPARPGPHDRASSPWRQQIEHCPGWRHCSDTAVPPP